MTDAVWGRSSDARHGRELAGRRQISPSNSVIGEGKYIRGKGKWNESLAKASSEKPHLFHIILSLLNSATAGMGEKISQVGNRKGPAEREASERGDFHLRTIFARHSQLRQGAKKRGIWVPPLQFRSGWRGRGKRGSWGRLCFFSVF